MNFPQKFVPHFYKRLQRYHQLVVKRCTLQKSENPEIELRLFIKKKQLCKLSVNVQQCDIGELTVEIKNGFVA